jgi:hypothetical protein
MQTIRKNIFETNSSSSHSISIDFDSPEADLLTSLEVNSKGEVIIYTRTFGWEVEDYYDAETKASYCWTWANSYTDNKKYLTMLEKVIKEQTGAESITFSPKDASYMDYDEEDSDLDYEDGALDIESGSIDHQSQDVCRKAFRSERSLRRFIFSSKSLLHTDNDNH